MECLGLTYVTGALVKVGQLAAAALVAGCACGALVYHRINLAAIWFAAGAALALGAIVAVTVHR